MERAISCFVQQCHPSQLMEKRSPQSQQPEAPNLPPTAFLMNRSAGDEYCQSSQDGGGRSEKVGPSIPADAGGTTNIADSITRVSKEINDTQQETIGNNQDTVASRNVPTTGGAGHARAPLEQEDQTRFQPGNNKALTAFSDTSSKKSPGGTKKGASKDERLLPEDFKPTQHSVIIGRRRESKDHAAGNNRLRALVAQHVPEYANAVNRSSMSKIVSSVVAQVREACFKDMEERCGTSSDGSGAFVRLGREDGRWYEVSDAVAREKVGYTFRDMLGDRYRSSSQSKVARKRQLRGEEEVCKGKKRQQKQLQQIVLKPREGQEPTSDNLKPAPRSPAQQEQQGKVALRQFGEESSDTQKWPQSISPHQMPPPGFILLEGANTPHDFFGPSSSGSSSTATISHAKEDDTESP